MKTNRRDFLKISGLGLGGILASRDIAQTAASTVDELFPGKKRIPTYCEVCFWKCAAWVKWNKKGELCKIVGNESDPLCKGRLCPRGTAGLGMYSDPDRLKTPLIRSYTRKGQYYREASWPEAIDYIASRTRKIINESGAESLALFSHGSGGKHFTRFLRALGSGNYTAPSYAQCRGPRDVAFKATYGTPLPSPEPLDIKNTNCLVLIGSHLGENMHNSQVQEMSQLIDRGVDIITVDPRLSTAAAHSTMWLPIKPATDLALLLAWMNVIIEEGLYDRNYIENYCFGFEDLQTHLEDKTPEWAASITNLDPEKIRKAARMMAQAAPSVIVHPGRHVTWYGDDTQRSRAIAILNALLGSYGRKGGIFIPQAAKIPSYPHPAYPKPKWDWKQTLNGRYSLAHLSVSNALIDASHPDNATDNKIRGWFIVGTNLIHTVPDIPRTIEALQNQDLVVVVDTMPAEITGYADVVLPECTYLERYDDLRASPYREATVAVRTPALKPKWLTKPAYWMVKKLAYKFGLQPYFNYSDYDDVLSWQANQMGISYTELVEKGMLKVPNPSNLYFDPVDQPTFNTATGMIELYSFAFEDEGFDPLPDYTEHPEPPDGYFRLNYGRAPMHTFSRTGNNHFLYDLYPESPVWVNPEVAENLGLRNGDRVILENSEGVSSEFSAKVRVTNRIGPDSVYMVHGFGHSDPRMKKTYAKGISDTQLMTNVMIDPVMGGTGMRGNFVKIRKKSREGLFS